MARLLVPPIPERVKPPVPPTEVRIQPMFVRVPETTRETTYIERIVVEQPAPVERHTDALPVVTPQPAQVVVITQPERNRDESPVRTEGPADDDTRQYSPRTRVPEMDVSPVVTPPDREQKPVATPEGEVKEPEQKTFGENVRSGGKKRSGNNSPIISPTIPVVNDSVPPVELFGANKPAPTDDAEEFEKLGPGRQRRYEELGEKDIEPVRELVLFRNELGRHWPGLSKDMEQYYEHFYFTKPNRRKDGKNYERHVKCWERRTKWLAATQPTPDSH